MAKYRRERQAKWDKRHLVTVSTHLREEQYQTLRALCTLRNERPYFIVRKALLDYIGEYGGNSEVDIYKSGILGSEEERRIDFTEDQEVRIRHVDDSRRERLRLWRTGEF